MTISRKRLEELENIPESAIDTSDIPELDDTFWLNNQELQDQIKVAKEKHKEIYWKIFEVEYWKSTKSLNLLFELEKEYRVSGQKHFTGFTVEISEFKCLKGKTEEQIEKVSLLGDRAIQWEELDIQIDLEDLLTSIQLRENWLNSLK